MSLPPMYKEHDDLQTSNSNQESKQMELNVFDWVIVLYDQWYPGNFYKIS